MNNKKIDEERAYGGIVRSVKGKLQEHMTEEIIKAMLRDEIAPQDMSQAHKQLILDIILKLWHKMGN